MITMLGSPRRCCDGFTRRETLAAGALTLLGSGFTLPNFLGREQANDAAGRFLPEHFGKNDGSVAGRAAAHVVSRIDENHRQPFFL